jgi:hypothetical protein
MGIDPRILFQLNAPFDPVQSMARAEQLRAMRVNNTASLLDLQQKQKAVQDRENMDAAAKSAYQTPAPVTTQAPSLNIGGTSLPGSISTVQGPAQFDRAAFLSKLAQTNPLDAVGMQGQFATQDAGQAKVGLDIREQVQKLQKGDLDMALTKMKTANQQIGSVLALPPELRPQGYSRILQGLKQGGLIEPNHPEQYPGDDAIKGELAQGLSAEQIFQQEKDARDHTDRLAQQQQELQSKTVQTAEGVMGYNPKTGKYDQRIGSPTKALVVNNGKADNARMDKSYQYNASALTKIATPIEQLSARMGRLQDTINQSTPQADALVAPELMTVMAGGQGSGLRLNEAEISRVIGGRTNLESLKAALNKWQVDPSKGLSITPAQRDQIRALMGEVNSKLIQKRQIVEEANQKLIGAADVSEHRKIVADTRSALADIDAGKSAGISVTDPQGGVHTFPDQASADKFKALAKIK